MRAFADSNLAVYMLYRGAQKSNQRDIYLLSSPDRGKSFEGKLLKSWTIDGCPMSSGSFSEGSRGVVAAWEGDDKVFAALVPRNNDAPKILEPSGEGSKRRHPTVATNQKGETLLAWVENMTWKTPGQLKWALFDEKGKELESSNDVQKVPTWGVVSVASTPDGNFVVLY